MRRYRVGIVQHVREDCPVGFAAPEIAKLPVGPEDAGRCVRCPWCYARVDVPDRDPEMPLARS